MTDPMPTRPSRRALAARRWLFAALGLVAFACNLNPRPDTNGAGDEGSKGNGGLPSAAGGAFGTGGAASVGGAYTGAGGAPGAGAASQDAGAFPPSIGADGGDAGPSDAGEDAGD